jgi:hypothetical protein
MIYGYARVSTDGQTAKVEGDRHMIEGDQTGGDGRASLFMDRFGFACFRADFGRGLRPRRCRPRRRLEWPLRRSRRLVSRGRGRCSRGGRGGSGALLRRSVPPCY